MRLIDADALKERAIRVSTVKDHCYFKAVGTREIDKAPTIDAVPVVRCKDCKYGEYDYTEYFDYYECRYIGGNWNKGDHFCSYGKRREGE